MKLFDFSLFPNPRRTRIFIAEKALQIPIEQVDALAGANQTPEFLKKNPSGGLPVLELDDGSCLAESVAICRYLEGLHPDPNLMGRDSREQAFIEQWNRRMELELFAVVARFFLNTGAFFKGRLPQVPEYGEVQRANAVQRLKRMDAELAGREFVAADRYTIADITALVGIDLFCGYGGQPFPPPVPPLPHRHEDAPSPPPA